MDIPTRLKMLRAQGEILEAVDSVVIIVLFDYAIRPEKISFM